MTLAEMHKETICRVFTKYPNQTHYFYAEKLGITENSLYNYLYRLGITKQDFTPVHKLTFSLTVDKNQEQNAKRDPTTSAPNLQASSNGRSIKHDGNGGKQ